MKKRRYAPTSAMILLSLAATGFAANGFCSDAPGQNDAEEQVRLSDPNAIECAASTIDEWEESVRKSFGLGDWGEHDGKIFAFASQTAAFPATDPQFGNALSVAFELAMRQIQQDVAMIRFGREAIEKSREFYSDDSSAAREIPVEIPTRDAALADKAYAIMDKSLDVAGARLDQELISLGVEPKEVETATPIRKKTLFKELFTKQMVKNAAGDIAGIFPIQTTVVIDKDGNATIGVIAVFSPKTVQVARDVAAQRKSIVSGKGRDLSCMIPKDTAEKLGNLGVRLVYDEHGDPAIVSYAVAAYIPDGDDAYINAARKTAAKQKAIDLADAQISEVVNGQMSVRNERTTGQSVERFVEREMKAGSLTTERVVKDMVETVSEFSKSRAAMQLQGVSTLDSKFFSIPSGQQFYAVARVWKFSTLVSVTGGGGAPAPAASPAPKPTGNMSGVFQGGKYNTMEDF